ncbi:D-alanine--D-alanine ligase [Tenacibaculum sp. IB213877]|uniref:D-alanine--D-alanine ligase n=1 Tax=Tenacibaculum sp. IB213877 TaxID=3097351 RepID=UPI002A5AB569|nr:D-alanine--D-alanine ligase [Tenacibaculum sp. IB213877]MDY0779813.1 D-alanine--D-alanine ligase [Tenacibaculum sp. IB213877]
MLSKTSINKVLNWEHWPSSMFYVPNLPYAFYLAFRAGNTTFFTAANPALKSSGNGTESKYETIQLVPEKHRPKSVLVTEKNSFQDILNQLQKEKILYPLIAKPDVGFRGLLVKKIHSETELKQYLEKYPVNIILQEFLDYENECGVFYHKNPRTNKGHISSLTLKRFLSVIGDGKSTLKELILADERAKLYIDLFEEIHQHKLNEILKKEQKIKLTAIGNHSKGTQFINGNHLISEKLIQTFDNLSNSIDGWYYGRVDVKYNTFSALENGTDFKVLEINGVISEPTHIYDAENYSYFKALKTIRQHWKSLFKIATTNHYYNNITLVKPRVFINEMRWLKSYIKKIKKYSG